MADAEELEAMEGGFDPGTEDFFEPGAGDGMPHAVSSTGYEMVPLEELEEEDAAAEYDDAGGPRRVAPGAGPGAAGAVPDADAMGMSGGPSTFDLSRTPGREPPPTVP